MDEDPPGDVVGALLVVKALDGATSSHEDNWYNEVITRCAADPRQFGELLRGCSSLLRIWFVLLQPEDPFQVVAAVLNRLQRLPMIGDKDLPMIAAILTSAALDNSPILWAAESVTRFTSGEEQGWLIATWQLSDFFDFCAERPGSAVELAEQILLNAATK